MAIGRRMTVETDYTNSYAAMADGFLQGRLDVDERFDSDCAKVGGKRWVVFPPVPAIVALAASLWLLPALAVKEPIRPVFGLLATYGIGLNVATVAVLAVLPPSGS